VPVASVFSDNANVVRRGHRNTRFPDRNNLIAAREMRAIRRRANAEGRRLLSSVAFRSTARSSTKKAEMQNLQHQHIQMQSPQALHAYRRNARKHSKPQISALVRSIERFGFVNPVLVDQRGNILAGHARLEAAKQLKLAEVPTVCISHLSEAERRAYIIADNKLATMGSWSNDVLAIELKELVKEDFDIKVTGFDLADIPDLLDSPRNTHRAQQQHDEGLPALSEATVTRGGDTWVLGNHRLHCGDPRDPASIDALMGHELGDVIFSVPPPRLARTLLSAPQCPGLLKELSTMQAASYRDFLRASIGNAQGSLESGKRVFLGANWRDYGDVLDAGSELFGPPRDLCVWNGDLGLPGELYSCDHKLFLVFSNGEPDPHCVPRKDQPNPRSNVWTYPLRRQGRGKPAGPQTIRQHLVPVALVADAIADVTKPGGLVIDVFAGVGATLIAAQKTGRAARLIEHEPRLCDLIVHRYQVYTSEEARLTATGQTSAKSR
jgi:hypothetical protein